MISNNSSTNNSEYTAFYEAAALTHELREFMRFKELPAERMFVEFPADQGRPWLPSERKEYSDLKNQLEFLFGETGNYGRADFIRTITKNVFAWHVNRFDESGLPT